MIYRIVLDGVDIYGTTEDTTLIAPELTIDMTAAGSLEFEMPSVHKYYTSPKLMTSDVEVYEEDDLIWYGRVLEMSTRMDKSKSVYCEGPLAYFNDSIQRPQVFDTISIHSFFETVIANHNDQVPENRRFYVGEVTVDNTEVYRELNYETTKDVLDRMCLNAEGGYFYFRKENGLNYIDWRSSIAYDNNQPAQFGLNIVDIEQHIKGENLFTSIIPLGAEIDDVKLTIADENMGLDYIDSEAVSTFGRITKVVEFDEISTASELLTAGQKWLSEKQFEPLTIKCDAAELHYLDSTYAPFRVGQRVRVNSMPHLIDVTLALTTINLKLDSAVKKISVGTQERRELTEIYKPTN